MKKPERNTASAPGACSVSAERDALRMEQAKRVMPLIGGLLEFWDQLPGDLQTDPELEMLARQILAIDAAMELSPNKD